MEPNPQRNALAVLHSEAGHTGWVGESLARRGIGTHELRPVCGDELPARVDDYAAVVIFGGPMSANDEHLDFISEELRWVERVVLASQTPVMGICLGAQIVARTLGAKVAPHPEGLLEAGYYTIKATEAGSHLFPPELAVYQWHREGFDLPSDGVRLAAGDDFENQAFRIEGAPIYGVQFHPEMTEPIMQRWLDTAGHMLVEPGARPPEVHHKGHAAHGAAMQRWLDRFWDVFFEDP